MAKIFDSLLFQEQKKNFSFLTQMSRIRATGMDEKKGNFLLNFHHFSLLFGLANEYFGSNIRFLIWFSANLAKMNCIWCDDLLWTKVQSQLIFCLFVCLCLVGNWLAIYESWQIKKGLSHPCQNRKIRSQVFFLKVVLLWFMCLLVLFWMMHCIM